jgi:hypothetical protein
MGSNDNLLRRILRQQPILRSQRKYEPFISEFLAHLLYIDQDFRLSCLRLLNIKIADLDELETWDFITAETNFRTGDKGVPDVYVVLQNREGVRLTILIEVKTGAGFTYRPNTNEKISPHTPLAEAEWRPQVNDYVAFAERESSDRQKFVVALLTLEDAYEPLLHRETLQSRCYTGNILWKALYKEILKINRDRDEAIYLFVIENYFLNVLNEVFGMMPFDSFDYSTSISAKGFYKFLEKMDALLSEVKSEMMTPILADFTYYDTKNFPSLRLDS